MIPELGVFSLIIALMMSFVGLLAPNMGYISKRLVYLQQLTFPAVRVQSLFILVSFVTLMSCFAIDDFTLSYVAQNSHTTLPWIYKLCALWGAHEGSLLLWAFILAMWTLAVSFHARRLPLDVALTLLSVLSAISVGFILLLLHTSNPFSRILPFSPSDGADLNPLLQDPGFVMHPPFLYMGYVGLAVPFAIAICAMVHKNKAFDFASFARPWALMAWAFLTIGITLGSWWAYYELGWGGWWFWDPVENASFMPWLGATALVHALYLNDKRQLFHSWSLLLALSAFILSLIGTFLVRSGVISSVHAFASDPLRGMFILGFISIVVVLAFGLYFWRGIAKDDKSSSLYSRESFMLLGNILLFVATLTVLLGTLYPILAQVFLDEKLSVGPPYFNSVFNPIVLAILAIMTIGPHLKWHSDKLTFKTSLAGAAIGIGLFLLIHKLLPDSFSLLATLGVIFACALMLSTVFIAWKNAKQIFTKLGMMLAHFGVGVCVLGVALTTTLETEKELSLKVGQSTVIKDYGFIFTALEDIQGSNYQGVKATFEIKENNHLLYTAYPEKRYFIPRNLPMTETAIVPTLLQDFYIALGERLDNGSWAVRIYIKPFVRFIWLGGLIIALGAFLASFRAFNESYRRQP